MSEVFFHTPQHGWIVGDDSIFMHTTDGGETWEQSESFPRTYFDDPTLHYIDFVDDQNGFAAGPDGLYRTADAGATWEQTPGWNGNPVAFDFVTPELGFMLVGTINGSAVLRTIDGGDSFETVSGVGASDFDFLDETHGVFVSASGVWETFDAGATWDQISTQALTHVVYVTADILVGIYNSNVVPNDNAFYRSTDGGVSWEFVYADNKFPGAHEITDLETIVGDSVAAVQVSGAISVSNDTG